MELAGKTARTIEGVNHQNPFQKTKKLDNVVTSTSSLTPQLCELTCHLLMAQGKFEALSSNNFCSHLELVLF